jgi:uncharacterized protein
VVTEERANEVTSVLERLTRWARQRTDVRALALVGSWAHGSPHSGSDVDVVLLTNAPRTYIENDLWLDDVVGAQFVRTQAWGPITERRFRLASGLEVELGVGTPDWASVEPLDSGTREVVSDGMRPLYDPDGLLTTLAAECGSLRQERSEK